MPIRRRPLPISSIHFSKDNIRLGLAQGRALIELKESEPALHRWIEELIEEGKAFAGTWIRHPKSGEIYRTIFHRPLEPGEKVKKDVDNQ
jgi:hypothetical protein